eukprot:11157226-Lingulodinium_polyedra.AAC.1
MQSSGRFGHCGARSCGTHVVQRVHKKSTTTTYGVVGEFTFLARVIKDQGGGPEAEEGVREFIARAVKSSTQS